MAYAMIWLTVLSFEKWPRYLHRPNHHTEDQRGSQRRVGNLVSAGVAVGCSALLFRAGRQRYRMGEPGRLSGRSFRKQNRPVGL
jgi:hypothetical protein